MEASCTPAYVSNYTVTYQKIIILFPVLRIIDFMVIMYGKANLCPQNGDGRFLRNNVTSQQTASYLRRLLSDCQLTNFCVGWYDGGTGKM
jgi:hypothetical protein